MVAFHVGQNKIEPTGRGLRERIKEKGLATFFEEGEDYGFVRLSHGIDVRETDGNPVLKGLIAVQRQVPCGRVVLD